MKFSFKVENFTFIYLRCMTSSGHWRRWFWVSGNNPHVVHQGLLFCPLKFSFTSRVLLLNLNNNCFSLVLNRGSWMYLASFSSLQSKYFALECFELTFFSQNCETRFLTHPVCLYLLMLFLTLCVINTNDNFTFFTT